MLLSREPFVNNLKVIFGFFQIIMLVYALYVYLICPWGQPLWNDPILSWIMSTTWFVGQGWCINSIFSDLANLSFSGCVWCPMEKLPWKLAYSHSCLWSIHPYSRYFEESLSSKSTGDVYCLAFDFRYLLSLSAWSLVCSLISTFPEFDYWWWCFNIAFPCHFLQYFLHPINCFSQLSSCQGMSQFQSNFQVVLIIVVNLPCEDQEVFTLVICTYQAALAERKQTVSCFEMAWKMLDNITEKRVKRGILNSWKRHSHPGGIESIYPTCANRN